MRSKQKAMVRRLRFDMVGGPKLEWAKLSPAHDLDSHIFLSRTMMASRWERSPRSRKIFILSAWNCSQLRRWQKWRGLSCCCRVGGVYATQIVCHFFSSLVLQKGALLGVKDWLNCKYQMYKGNVNLSRICFHENLVDRFMELVLSLKRNTFAAARALLLIEKWSIKNAHCGK